MPHQLPALLLGIIVTVYWARVLKMVVKQRRRTGRDANFVPRETLGRTLRIIWYPAVILWIIIPFVAALWPGRIPGLNPYRLPIAFPWIAAFIAAACLILTWICWRKMGRSWRMGIDPDEKTQLIVSGPYAYVRHPIYALQILLALASMVVILSFAMVVTCGIIIIFLYWEARREEEYLLRLHGEIYGSYKNCVGGFFPRSFVPYRTACV